MCEKGEGERFRKLECANGTCLECGNMKKWKTCPTTESENAEILPEDYVDVELWEKVVVLNSKGVAKDTHDFVKRRVHPYELQKQFKEFFDGKFREHHHTAVVQDAAWSNAQKMIANRQGTGYVLLVMDFAEKYLHLGLQEHQQKYYNQTNTTLFMMHVYVHLEDMKTILEPEKIRLRKLFEEKGADPIIHISLPVISEDPEQDVAFVIHVLKNITSKWIRQHVQSPQSQDSVVSDMYDVHIFTDGCKAQFKNSTYLWYLSEQRGKAGMKFTSNFFCSCHGKCQCDPDGGSIKGAARDYEMGKHDQSTSPDLKLKHAKDFYDFCQRKLCKIEDGGVEKTGKGLYRREFFYIPRSGEGCINRRHIHHAATLKGSSKWHRFATQVFAGHILTSKHSCPLYCGMCMDQNYSRCPNKRITGEMTERQIDVKGMNINFQSSRGHIERWGEEHGKTIKVGDLIGWEDAESQSCPFHILLVSKEKYSVGSKHGVETITPWDGGSRKFEQGTQVFGCKRLCKDDTAETTYYWDGDEADLVLDCKGIRVVDMTISIVHRRGRRGNRNQTTYLIDEDELHQLKLSVGDFESLHEPR